MRGGIGVGVVQQEGVAIKSSSGEVGASNFFEETNSGFSTTILLVDVGRRGGKSDALRFEPGSDSLDLKGAVGMNVLDLDWGMSNEMLEDALYLGFRHG